MIVGAIAMAVMGFQAQAPRVKLGYTQDPATFAAWKKQYAKQGSRLETVPLERGKFWIGYELEGVVESVEVVRELAANGPSDPAGWWACCSFNKATGGSLTAKLSKDKEFLVIYIRRTNQVVLTFTTL